MSTCKRPTHVWRDQCCRLTKAAHVWLQVDPGYAPYDEGTKADIWMRGVDGKPYLGWVSWIGLIGAVAQL